MNVHGGYMVVCVKQRKWEMIQADMITCITNRAKMFYHTQWRENLQLLFKYTFCSLYPSGYWIKSLLFPTNRIRYKMHKLSMLISLTFYIRRIILGIYQFAFGIFYHLIIKDTALMMLGVNVMFIWFLH